MAIAPELRSVILHAQCVIALIRVDICEIRDPFTLLFSYFLLHYCSHIDSDSAICLTRIICT
jgi:hypothetical protein